MITDSEDKIMIAELERIIQAEEAKPEPERDADLIDDCIREIAELKGVKADFSDEEVAEITNKLIKGTDREKRKKRHVRIAAGVAAVFVLVGGVTACTINPALINWFMKIVRMPFGASVTQDKITYINQGTIREYSNIAELIVSENLDIYYPTVIPNSESIQYIESFVNDEQKIITFDFTDANLHYLVETPCKKDFREGEVVLELDCNGLHFYVYQKESCYIAICEYADERYIIQTSSKNDIITIVGGLTKE